MEIKKYGRYWALYDRGDLVALVLYTKGSKKTIQGEDLRASPILLLGVKLKCE